MQSSRKQSTKQNKRRSQRSKSKKTRRQLDVKFSNPFLGNASVSYRRQRAPAAMGMAFAKTPPTQVRISRGVEIRNSEFLATLSGNTDIFAMQLIDINPGLSDVFPWLSTASRLYTKYRFKHLRFKYVPRCGSTQKGQYVMIGDRNVTATPPGSISAAYSYKDARICNCWMESSFGPMSGPELFLRYTPVEEGQDPKTYDTGVFMFGGEIDGTESVGQILVDYVVELLDSRTTSLVESSTVYLIDPYETSVTPPPELDLSVINIYSTLANSPYAYGSGASMLYDSVNDQLIIPTGAGQYKFEWRWWASAGSFGTITFGTTTEVSPSTSLSITSDEATTFSGIPFWNAVDSPHVVGSQSQVYCGFDCYLSTANSFDIQNPFNGGCGILVGNSSVPLPSGVNWCTYAGTHAYVYNLSLTIVPITDAQFSVAIQQFNADLPFYPIAKRSSRVASRRMSRPVWGHMPKRSFLPKDLPLSEYPVLRGGLPRAHSRTRKSEVTKVTKTTKWVDPDTLVPEVEECPFSEVSEQELTHGNTRLLSATVTRSGVKSVPKGSAASAVRIHGDARKAKGPAMTSSASVPSRAFEEDSE